MTIRLEISREYHPGDPAPDGYLDRVEWARAQLRAGLRQSRCLKCKRWKFPQQMDGAVCRECKNMEGQR